MVRRAKCPFDLRYQFPIGPEVVGDFLPGGTTLVPLAFSEIRAAIDLFEDCGAAGQGQGVEKRAGREQRAFLGLLHGGLLEFRHPVTGNRMTFESPAPTEWN